MSKRLGSDQYIFFVWTLNQATCMHASPKNLTARSTLFPTNDQRPTNASRVATTCARRFDALRRRSSPRRFAKITRYTSTNNAFLQKEHKKFNFPVRLAWLLLCSTVCTLSHSFFYLLIVVVNRASERHASVFCTPQRSED